MRKLEKKFGKYAVSNLTTILILCYVVGYVIQMINANFFEMLTLNPLAIMQGQVWRLVTWVVIPPEQLDIFTIIMLYFYYSVGKTLERAWGDYRYNVYIFAGLLFMIIAAFACLGVCNWMYGSLFEHPEIATEVFRESSKMFSTYYINMSIFLAFAATFPDAQILLMFVIPVRIKWMGLIYGGLLGVQFVTALKYCYSPVIVDNLAVLDIIAAISQEYKDVFVDTLIATVSYISLCGAILASLLTFGMFWITSRSRIHMTPKQMKRRHEFKQEVKVNSRVTKHKCAICGQTNESNENLEFRFCSKCNGNYEYCQDHLFTHEHVK